MNYAESIGDKIKKYKALHENLNDLEKCVSVCKDASVTVRNSLLSCGISEEELDKIEADVDSDSSPKFFSVGSSEVDEPMEGARKNLFETFGVVGNPEQEAESSFKSPKTKSSCSAKSSKVDKSNETRKKDRSCDSSKTPDRSSHHSRDSSKTPDRSSHHSRDSSKTRDESSKSSSLSKTSDRSSHHSRDSSKTRDESSKSSSSSKTSDVSSKGSSLSKTSDVSSRGSSLSKTSDLSSKSSSSSKTSDVSSRGSSSSKTSDLSSKGSSLSKTPDVPSETSHKDDSSSKKDKNKHTPIQDSSKKHRRKPSCSRDSSVSSVEVITIDSDSDAGFDTLIGDDEVDITKVKVELNEALAEGDKKESHKILKQTLQYTKDNKIKCPLGCLSSFSSPNNMFIHVKNRICKEKNKRQMHSCVSVW